MESINEVSITAKTMFSFATGVPKYKVTDLGGNPTTFDQRFLAGVSTLSVPLTSGIGFGAKLNSRAFFSGAGTEARAINEGFMTLSQTRAGKNLQNLIDSKNIPWDGVGGAESMWRRLSATWAKGIPNGSSVPVFLNNPRPGSIWLTTELPILQSKGVNLIYK